MPAACGRFAPITLERVTTRCSGNDQWFGICRPPELGSSALAKRLSMTCSALIPSTTITPVSR